MSGNADRFVSPVADTFKPGQAAGVPGELAGGTDRLHAQPKRQLGTGDPGRCGIGAARALADRDVRAGTATAGRSGTGGDVGACDGEAVRGAGHRSGGLSDVLVAQCARCGGGREERRAKRGRSDGGAILHRKRDGAGAGPGRDYDSDSQTKPVRVEPGGNRGGGRAARTCDHRRANGRRIAARVSS